jgi:hypothetical protein
MNDRKIDETSLSKKNENKKRRNKNMVRIWRQGDVIVREVSEIPEKAVRAEANEIRIASETGNPHVLKVARVFERKDARGALQPRQQYVVLEEAATMSHPQHASLQLSAGMYRITTVRDYAPARRLLD